MKKQYLLTLLIVQLGFSQAPAVEWQKCLGGTNYDEAISIKQTTDGGYILAGFTNSNDFDVIGFHGNHDAWIVKLSNTGTLLWQKTLGGTDYDMNFSIQQTTDGGYIAAGYATSNDGDITGNHGVADFMISKLSDSGDLLWQKILGGLDDDEAFSIQQTTDNGYIVAGYTYSANGDITENKGGYDAWIVKLSDTGTLLWQKTFGGTGYDEAHSIKQTADGGYIFAGYTTSLDGDTSGNHGGYDAWIVKLSDTGTLLWQKTLGGSTIDYATSIQETTDGGYIFAGFTTSNNGDVTGNHGEYDVWIEKLSNTGSLLWQKVLGGTNIDYAQSIQLTTDGGYIVAGFTTSNNGDVTGNHGAHDAWIIKLSNEGNLLWQKALGATDIDYADSVQQTTDGGYIVSGYTVSTDGYITGNHGGYDAWVVKLGSDALGTNTFATNQIKLFPNPTTSILTVQGYNTFIFDKMIVTDLTGKTVMVQEQNSNQINIESLAGGIYFLQAYSGEDIFTGKFIKE